MKDTQKINFPAVFVLVFYPIVILFLAFFYIKNYGISSYEIGLMIIAYYVCNISVGIGLHRLWAHGTYKANKYAEFILALISAGTLQGPALAWASDHDKHHSYTDTPKDPHTPLKYKSKILGFYWSHIGWMLVGEMSYKNIERSTMKRLGKNKIVMWQFKNYWKIALFMNFITPVIIGYAIGGNLQYALGGFIFIGIARALQQQATFCVNSVVHFFGTKEYCDGTAGDIPWLFFMLLGENWHNFHHAFPRDYRNGHKWYHLDVHKWIIYIMSKLGLASDLVVTSKERINVKKAELESKTLSNIMEKLEFVESMACKISDIAHQKLSQTEKSAQVMAENIRNKLAKLEKKAKILSIYAREIINSNTKHKEKITQEILSKLKNLERLAMKIGINNKALAN